MQEKVDMHRIATTAFAALALAVTAGLLVAGPLDPPTGPVASTYKTLTEVEPRVAINATNTPGDADSVFRITQPGSYYLTGNISVGLGFSGIEIDASNVTIDLMGFRLLGSIGAINGIFVNGTETNLTIRNGSVRSFGGDGLALTGADSVRVADFTVRNCSGRGVALGQGFTATNVITDSNSGHGFAAQGGGTITACSSRNNGGNGFSIDFETSITNSSATSNTGDGFNVSAGCLVSACMASNNGDDGFATLNSGTFTSCHAFSNTGDGFDSQGGGCVITSCTTKSNTGNGIRAGTNASVTQCAASLNVLSGILVGAGSLVTSCASSSNTVDGIRASSDCVVLANVCNTNGFNGDGAGIHATGSDNRIEGNNCAGADRGIDIDVAGNIIIKNTCAGNTTNWDIVADNNYGEIRSRVVSLSPAVLGDSGINTLITSESNANFSY